MSPEARVALITLPLIRSSLGKIAALLPEDDAVLLEWIEETVKRTEPDELVKLLYAAAAAGRKLPASLVAGKRLELFKDGWRFGWLAAHLEGDVTAALLTTSAEGTTPLVSAFAMYVAARWWMKHRPGEAFPGKLQAAPRNFRAFRGLTPDVESVMGAMAAMIKDAAVAKLWGGEGRKADETREYNFKQIEAFLAAPLEDSLPEKVTGGYVGTKPMRRAVEKIGRNDPCHCGSGKKHKECCLTQDDDRLRRSSAVAGKTWDELEDEGLQWFTLEKLAGLTLPELSRLYIARMPEEVQPGALQLLARAEYFDQVVEAFRELGLPDRLRGSWDFALQNATRAWRRDVAMRLIEACGDKAPPLEELRCNVRLLLASQDAAEFCAAVEAESLALLQAHDSKGLEYLVAGLTWSPYRALGIMVARGALLLTEPQESGWIFNEILSKRGDLGLPIDDPSADLLDERASRRAAGDDDTGLAEAQEKLEAKAAEVRQVREKLAAMQREIALREKRERRSAAERSTIAAAGAAEPAELRELRRKTETLKSLLNERGEERARLRREVEKLHTDLATLKEAQDASAPAAQEESDEPAGEAVEVHGQQPLRNIELPPKVYETLASFPPQVGRATMALLGRLAAGEASAFRGLVKIYECENVVRARVAGDYRLLLHFKPQALEVVDVVLRRDLQRRLKQLRAKGA